MSHDTLAALRLQLQQLQALHASGTLDDAAFGAAKERLQQRIVERVMAGETETPAAVPAAAGATTATTATRRTTVTCVTPVAASKTVTTCTTVSS